MFILSKSTIKILFIEKLLQNDDDDNNKIAINLQRCLRCKNLIEMFEVPLEGESAENVLYQILQDRERKFKLKFQALSVLCPQCKKAQENVTYLSATEDDLNLLNNTPLADIWITVK